MFFLNQDKNWKRKAAEFIITLQLEQKLSKEDIFEYYANQVDLGWRGTFHIVGLAQASEAYLGKDLNSINLPEAAQLAGMIQRPGYFDPFRHPDRLKERRNIVLQLMRQNGVVNDRDYALATEAELTVNKSGSNSVEAPYFVDMVNDKLQSMFQDTDLQSNAFRIYTTVDMRLQRAFRVGGRTRIDGILEVYNLLNHENYGNYVTTETARNYGAPSAVQNVSYYPRTLQLGFHVAF